MQTFTFRLNINEWFKYEKDANLFQILPTKIIKSAASRKQKASDENATPKGIK